MMLCQACDGRYVNFKQYLKCHHNVQRGKIGKHKHTGCPAKMIVTIRPLPRRFRNTGVPPPPDIALCDIDLIWNHNHAILTLDVLKHQRVTPDTQVWLIYWVTAKW